MRPGRWPPGGAKHVSTTSRMASRSFSVARRISAPGGKPPPSGISRCRPPQCMDLHLRKGRSTNPFPFGRRHKPSASSGGSSRFPRRPLRGGGGPLRLKKHGKSRKGQGPAERVVIGDAFPQQQIGEKDRSHRFPQDGHGDGGRPHHPKQAVEQQVSEDGGDDGQKEEDPPFPRRISGHPDSRRQVICGQNPGGRQKDEKTV